MERTRHDLRSVLQPVRRVLQFAAKSPEDAERVRYLSATTGRWLKVAKFLVSQPLEVDAIQRECVAFDSLDDGEDRYELARKVLPRLDGLRPVSKAPRRRRPRSKAKTAPPAVVFWDGDLSTPLSGLDVEPGVPELLAEQGAETAGQVLYMRPSEEEVLAPIHGAGRPIPAAKVAVGGRVRGRWTRLSPDGTAVSELILRGAGPLKVRFATRMRDGEIARTSLGTKVVMAGEYDPEADILTDAEIVLPAAQSSVFRMRYGVDGLSDRRMRYLLGRLLDDIDKTPDPVPPLVLQAARLPSLADALRGVHRRGSAWPEGTRRMAFDEAFFAQLGLSLDRFRGARDRGLPHPALHRHSSTLRQMDVLPQLSDESQLVADAIKRDLRRAQPMRRLLIGPNGAHQFDLAILASVMVADGRSQVLWLAPNPAVASLRAAMLSQIFERVGQKVALLTDKPTRAEREAVTRAETQVVVTASAEVAENLAWRRCGLVVAEEAGTYGQIWKVGGELLKGPRPDLLVVTGTPVPLRLLQQVYADFDVSLLGESRRGPRGALHLMDQREYAYKAAHDCIQQGGQVLVVYPQARGTDTVDSDNFRRLLDQTRATLLPERRVAGLHGSMRAADRLQVLSNFDRARTDALVCTDAFEALPDVGDVRLVVVEYANRVAMHRLLRLRDRFDPEVEFHFIVDAGPDDPGVRRVSDLASGFPADVLVERYPDQYPVADGVALGDDIVRWRWMRPERELALFIEARNAANQLIASDPTLRRVHGGRILKELRRRWADLLSVDPASPDDGLEREGAGPQAPRTQPTEKPRRRRRRRKRK